VFCWGWGVGKELISFGSLDIRGLRKEFRNQILGSIIWVESSAMD